MAMDSPTLAARLRSHIIILLILGGSTYTALNLAIERNFPDHWAGSPDRLLGLSYADWSRLLWIPEALLLVGFLGVRRSIGSRLGRWGALGTWLTVSGFALNILGLVIEFWVFGIFLVPLVGEFRTGSPGSNLGYAVNGLGSVLLILGLLLFAGACWLAGISNRIRNPMTWIAVSALSSLYFYFSNQYAIHLVLHGALWVVAGIYIREITPAENGRQK